MDPNLKAAIAAANSAPTDSGNPLGASQAAELDRLYAPRIQAASLAPIVQAAGKQADQKVAEQEQAAKIAAKKAQDMGDIRAYKIVKKQDGGYDFFDPNGQQVDIATLSNRTGENPANILKGSENPIDIQYVNDYNNLQDFISAVVSGDHNKVSDYVRARPELQQYNNKGGLNNLISKFRQSYQRYYVTRAQDPNAWGFGVPGNSLVPVPQSQFEQSSGGNRIGG